MLTLLLKSPLTLIFAVSFIVKPFQFSVFSEAVFNLLIASDFSIAETFASPQPVKVRTERANRHKYFFDFININPPTIILYFFYTKYK